MAEEKILYTGTPVDQAQGALILVHGRGADATSMLSLAEALETPGLACLLPQAPGNSWYPYSFLAPLEQNEPYLSNALGILAGIFAQLAPQVSPDRVLLLGFSQGACLALEYAARNAQRYGGLAGLSGGLIGPPGTPRQYPGSLDGTPVFLGCSTMDPHIPRERVLETGQVLEGLGAQVTTRLYENLGHTINEDELRFVMEMVKALV